MEDNIKIKLSIGDRLYPLTIHRSQEFYFREASKVIEKTIKKIKRLNSNNRIYASVGPCIGEKSYEVDISFYKRFVSKSRRNKIYFRYKNKRKKLFNIRKFVTDKLKKFNVKVD